MKQILVLEEPASGDERFIEQQTTTMQHYLVKVDQSNERMMYASNAQ